jgi:hypothetical protein
VSGRAFRIEVRRDGRFGWAARAEVRDVNHYGVKCWQPIKTRSRRYWHEGWFRWIVVLPSRADVRREVRRETRALARKETRKRWYRREHIEVDA